jgi:nickel/cobalt transporter (NiCoT) family protein
MRQAFFSIFNDEADTLRLKIGGTIAVIIVLNIVAWIWALLLFHHNAVLLGTALLAYGFGLRHAVDADHIAAIDNVTRKLMQEGKRPVTTGFFFSLGHSTVVVLASVAIAATTVALRNRFSFFQSAGGVVGTLVSSSFLLAIAGMNLAILVAVYRMFRQVKGGAPYREADVEMLLAGRGFLARLFRPLFSMIRHSWHMYPLGFLFGLGFDTATEVGLLGISATQSSHGMSVWSILIFPALFTVGMSLVDTMDSILMLGAYGWAFVRPIRKLYYNMTTTFVSVVVALLVGGIEALGLIEDQLNLKGFFWGQITALNHNFGAIGYLIIGVFLASWLLSAFIYRARGYDQLQVETS